MLTIGSAPFSTRLSIITLSLRDSPGNNET
jgi:hypothetical protein